MQDRLVKIIDRAVSQGWTALNLSRYGLTEIPEAIFSLTNLRTLNLYDNQITEIPKAIANLSNLKTLNLYNNKINHISEEITSLSELETLDLRKNLLAIPIEIIGSQHSIGAVSEIFNYIDQMRINKVRPLNEAKLLLIGQGNVGKTSLIERLLYDRYDKNQPQTDGLNVETWNIQVENQDVRLNVWDFGGQEIYHATHQFFLTERSLYLLVCNCRTSEEENRIEYGCN